MFAARLWIARAKRTVTEPVLRRIVVDRGDLLVCPPSNPRLMSPSAFIYLAK